MAGPLFKSRRRPCSVKFNATKSKSTQFAARGRVKRHSWPDFCISGHSIEYVDKYVHLGHVISSDLSDKEDIQRCRSNLVGQINNVICFFGKLDVVTKMKLLTSYCYGLYGGVIWNLTDPGIEQVCLVVESWNTQSLGFLPRTAHNNLLPLISCQPPLSDVIANRFISYVQRCLTSDCDIVNYVVQYSIWFGCMASPVGCSLQHCCNKHGFTADNIACVSTKSTTECWSSHCGYCAHAAPANHRLRGSASRVLTATHHSYGSPRLSDFSPAHLWWTDPSMDIHAKWLKRRVFTQGCAFCSKSRYFSYPLISRPPKGQNFANFWTENFRSIWPLTLEVTKRTALILHRSPMKVA